VEGKHFFFEKKKQKTFIPLSLPKLTNAFWSFFSKKDYLLLGLALACLILAAPLLHEPGSIWAGSLLRKDLVLALLGAATLVYLCAVYLVLHRPFAARVTWWVFGVALLVRAGLIVTPPFMSSDVYRYVWDGHVQAAGINPYVYVPNDPALAALRDAVVYPNINRLDYAHTIYPPAAQLIYWAADYVGYSVVATKFVLLLLEAAGMAALWWVLVLAGLPSARLLIYAWNPLAIWAFAADGHVDAAAVGLLALALLARFTGRSDGGRQALAGTLLGGAILVKFLPVVVAPALWRRWAWRMPCACALTILALYACYLKAGWQVLGFLPAYAKEEGMAQGGGYWLLSVLGSVVSLPHAAGTLYFGLCAAGLCAAALWMAFRQTQATGRAEIQRVGSNAAILAAGTMLAMSPHYGWYFAWLSLFAAIAPWRSLIFLGCAPLVLYADPYHATLIIPTLVFLPALLLAAWDMFVRAPIGAMLDAG
jgi:hypothetical protein